MLKLLLSFFLLPPFLISSDLEELITYDSGTKDHLLFSRRCSALNYYLNIYIPSFDQKAEDHGYFFHTMIFGFSALDYFETREDFNNSNEDQLANFRKKTKEENERYLDKYIEFYFSLTKDYLEVNDFTDEDDFNEIIPSLILSDYEFCLAFYDFLQEEIDKSPDELNNLRKESAEK